VSGEHTQVVPSKVPQRGSQSIPQANWWYQLQIKPPQSHSWKSRNSRQHLAIQEWGRPTTEQEVDGRY